MHQYFVSLCWLTTLLRGWALTIKRRTIDALEKDVKAAIGKIPIDRRKIITNHNAFGYFGDAYGMEFIAPEGLSTDSEPSASGV